jgi:hypothetical protein
MDCHEVFGTQDWPDRLRVHAAIYREIAERTDDPFIKNELLDLASVCEEVASNIEDHLTGEEEGAAGGPLSKLS